MTDTCTNEYRLSIPAQSVPPLECSLRVVDGGASITPRRLSDSETSCADFQTVPMLDTTSKFTFLSLLQREFRWEEDTGAGILNSVKTTAFIAFEKYTTRRRSCPPASTIYNLPSGVHVLVSCHIFNIQSPPSAARKPNKANVCVSGASRCRTQ